MKYSLAEIQSVIHKAIVENSEGALRLLVPPPGGKTAAAFKVYQDAYTLRLAGFLANDFPMLKAYIGDDRFDEMARHYINAKPSRHPNARWYSDNLPQFLKTAKAFAENGECIELATLEHALTHAFDAIDAQTMTLADLAAIPPEQAGDLQLRLHPSATVLTCRQNTTSIWSALKADIEPPHPHKFDQPQKILVFRQDHASRFRLLGDEEAMALACIEDGMRFAVLCEMMAFQNAADEVPQRAAMLLRIWIESQLLLADCADGAAK